MKLLKFFCPPCHAKRLEEWGEGQRSQAITKSKILNPRDTLGGRNAPFDLFQLGLGFNGALVSLGFIFFQAAEDEAKETSLSPALYKQMEQTTDSK